MSARNAEYPAVRLVIYTSTFAKKRKYSHVNKSVKNIDSTKESLPIIFGQNKRIGKNIYFILKHWEYQLVRIHMLQIRQKKMIKIKLSIQEHNRLRYQTVLWKRYKYFKVLPVKLSLYVTQF